MVHVLEVVCGYVLVADCVSRNMLRRSFKLVDIVAFYSICASCASLRSIYAGVRECAKHVLNIHLLSRLCK